MSSLVYSLCDDKLLCAKNRCSKFCTWVCLFAAKIVFLSCNWRVFQGQSLSHFFTVAPAKISCFSSLGCMHLGLERRERFVPGRISGPGWNPIPQFPRKREKSEEKKDLILGSAANFFFPDCDTGHPRRCTKESWGFFPNWNRRKICIPNPKSVFLSPVKWETGTERNFLFSFGETLDFPNRGRKIYMGK